MKTFEGLMVPESGVGDTPEKRQNARCANSIDTSECLGVMCRECVFAVRNIEAFKRWEGVRDEYHLY